MPATITLTSPDNQLRLKLLCLYGKLNAAGASAWSTAHESKLVGVGSIAWRVAGKAARDVVRDVVVDVIGHEARNATEARAAVAVYLDAATAIKTAFAKNTTVTSYFVTRIDVDANVLGTLAAQVAWETVLVKDPQIIASVTAKAEALLHPPTRPTPIDDTVKLLQTILTTLTQLPFANAEQWSDMLPIAKAVYIRDLWSMLDLVSPLLPLFLPDEEDGPLGARIRRKQTRLQLDVCWGLWQSLLKAGDVYQHLYLHESDVEPGLRVATSCACDGGGDNGRGDSVLQVILSSPIVRLCIEYAGPIEDSEAFRARLLKQLGTHREHGADAAKECKMEVEEVCC